MGACLGSNRSSRNPRYRDGQYPAMGKNQPLKKERLRWRSEVPMTEGQLRSKRDEFWETAPVFEGRIEIWDALKAAAQALERNDYAHAQAIIDGANICLPRGTLLDCYDELGTHYQLPVYCLAPPVNLLLAVTTTEVKPTEELHEITSTDKTLQMKIRIGTEPDIKLEVLLQDTIYDAKLRLERQEGITATDQKWIFAGKILPNSMRIEQSKIQKNFVVQCIVSKPQNEKAS